MPAPKDPSGPECRQYMEKIQELEKQLETFKQSVESIDHFFMITDTDGLIQYVNPGFLAFTGFTEDEVLMQKPSILKSGLMPDEYYTRLWKALKSGRSWKEEIINKKKNNDTYYAFQVISPIMGKNGDIIGFSAVQNDISEKKAAEKKLKDLLNEYDTIFNNTLDAIFLVGVENENIFRFLRLNRAHEELTGFRSQSVKGKTPEEVLGTETGRTLSKNYLTCVQRKTAIDYEETLDLPGGKKIWHTKLTPVIENGAVHQIIGVSRDITKEKVLAKERDIFFDVSLDMICIATFGGYFRQINPMWEKTLGWTEKELKSKPYLEFVHPDDVNKTLAASRHLEKGMKVISFENRYLKKDGSYNWLSWKSYPDPETGLIFAIARDMQKRKEMEEKLLFLSQTDPMLNIFNRGKLLSVLHAEIQKFKRYHSPLSIVMFDIDHFKHINDNFGHAAGDSVLKQLTGLVKSLIRDIDVFARWGGEEFIILLPQTGMAGAGNTAERIRRHTEKTDFGLTMKITLSFGAAAFAAADDADSFLKKVDDLLYLAKRNGRNRVELQKAG